MHTLDYNVHVCELSSLDRRLLWARPITPTVQYYNSRRDGTQLSSGVIGWPVTLEIDQLDRCNPLEVNQGALSLYDGPTLRGALVLS